MLKTFAGYSMPVNGINIASCNLGPRELRSTYFPPVEQGRDYVFSSPAPLWPFGFGLSYTTFSYTNLVVETPALPPSQDVRLSFTVQNTGSRPGQDVPQVYLRDDVSSVATPVMKLAGFAKIELAPGESRRLTLTVPARELALWNREMKRVVEPGTFTVMVGASAETIALRGAFRVEP